MDEPIIYSLRASPKGFPKTSPESPIFLYLELENAFMLDDKDEFLRLLKYSGYDQMQISAKECFLSKFNLIKILKEDYPQISMAVVSGETRDIIEDKNNLLVFKDGWTPLHLASATPAPKLIKCLIERGDPVDVPCDYYAPLNLKHATPLDVALEVIDTGNETGDYAENRPWTLRRSMFELFHYVCQCRKRSLEAIRLLVQNTQNKEHVRKAFFDSANEGKFVKVVALYLAAPELFLSTSLGGGSMSSIDELYLNLNSLDKTADIQEGLSLLRDVFDLVGHMLIAYIRLNDPKVWDLPEMKKTGFFLREIAQKKLGISSCDDYLLSLFKPVSQHAVEPPCIPPPKVGNQIHTYNVKHILSNLFKGEDININFVNKITPSLEPDEADNLRKAIDNKLSIMPNRCTLFEGTTRMPNKGEKQRSFFPYPRINELCWASSFCTEAANVRHGLDLKLIPRNGWERRAMNPTKLESFISAVRLSRFPLIAKRLIKCCIV